MNKPLSYEFARDGDRNTLLPDAKAADNSVSFQSGFTLPYETKPENGGKYIERQDMNEILYRICKGVNDTADAVDKWIALTTENLNNITAKGRYFQATQSQATVFNDYPIQQQGYLLVFDSINNNSLQIYKTAYSNRSFTRYSNSGAWSEWIEDSTTANSYTKAEIDSKVTNINNTIQDQSLSGLQVRSGSFTVDSNTNSPINFSSAFPNKCVVVVIFYSTYDRSKDGDRWLRDNIKTIANASKTSFSHGINTGTEIKAICSYFALGY